MRARSRLIVRLLTNQRNTGMTLKLDQPALQALCAQVPDSALARLESVVLFVGHAHSGHSLVGALLDAHPEVAISNHVNLPYLLREHDLDWRQLMRILYARAQLNADDAAWHNTGYRYRVDGAWQGRSAAPKVLGDKQGGASTRVLRQTPALLDELLAAPQPVRFIYVHRNPRDNVAAFAHYWGESLGPQHVQRYLENHRAVQAIQNRVAPERFFALAHEDFIADPGHWLMRLFDFLTVPADAAQIEPWLSLVRSTPHRRREHHRWPAELERALETGLARDADD